MSLPIYGLAEIELTVAVALPIDLSLAIGLLEPVTAKSHEGLHSCLGALGRLDPHTAAPARALLAALGNELCRQGADKS